MAAEVYDLVICGGTLVSAEGMRQADLAVQAGKIAAIGAGLAGRVAVDAGGRWVLPGGVDPHVHLEMPTPATVTSDDWASGTRAAACGGTTTVIDFVEPEPGQPLLEALQQRRAQAEGRAAVDFSLHMTLASADAATLAQAAAVAAAGAPSFKLYTTYAGFMLPDEGLLRAFSAIAAAGGLAMVHCENDAILQHSLARLRAAGRLFPADYPASRPAIAEVEAIQRCILLARYCGTQLYVAHISTGRGAGAVERARQHGQAVFGETCPQYLLLDEDRYAAGALEALKHVCAPPLRTRRDHAALWERLGRGALQSIGTDHCAFNLHGQKDRGREDFSLAPGGLPGVELRLALLHTFGVRAGQITPEQWVACCSSAPARLFGLYPRKGSLEPGADADLVIFDPQRRQRVSRELLHERVDYTPYEGLELTGWPAAVYLGGRLVARDGQPAGAAPGGQFIPGRLPAGAAV
jgi:dihydropyrimidinase